MSVVTMAAIRERIRRLFLEANPSFIAGQTGSVPWEVDDAYDTGCHRQHAVVLENAVRTGRLRDYSHPYLARYITSRGYNSNYGGIRNTPASAPIVDPPPSIPLAAWPDYALPLDMYIPVDVSISETPDDAAKYGQRVPPEMDRSIRTFPKQYGPIKGDHLWTIIADPVGSSSPPENSGRVLRLYSYGPNYVRLNQIFPFEVVYYRLIEAVAFESPPATNSDVEDPFNDGPVHFAVGILLEKAQQGPKAASFFTKAETFAAAVIQPPQAAA